MTVLPILCREHFRWLTHPPTHTHTDTHTHKPQRPNNSFVSIGYTAAAKMFSSTTRVCPSTANGQIAGFLNPVMASCQLVHVAEPGQEPGMWEAGEDMRLVCEELMDKAGAWQRGSSVCVDVCSLNGALDWFREGGGANPDKLPCLSPLSPKFTSTRHALSASPKNAHAQPHRQPNARREAAQVV